MDKKDIEALQKCVLVALVILVVPASLALAWVYLLDFIGAPRGIWQPLSFSGLLIGGAYLVLEIIKRRK